MLLLHVGLPARMRLVLPACARETPRHSNLHVIATSESALRGSSQGMHGTERRYQPHADAIAARISAGAKIGLTLKSVSFMATKRAFAAYRLRGRIDRKSEAGV